MNLTQLQAALQALGYTTDTAAQQTIFINNTYRKVCGMQRWPFLEAQDTSINTAAGTPGYTLGFTNWRNLDAVRIQIPATQQYTNLQYLSPQDFRDLEHVDRDVTTPFYWTFINQQLRFFPNPDAVYNVVIDYIIEPADLAAGTDVPVLPTQYHDVLVWGASKSIAYRERDWVGYEVSEGEYQMMLNTLEEEYMVRQRQTSSHVKKSGYWDVQLPYPFSQEGF